MSGNAWWMMGLAILVGAMLPLQALVNARLGTQIGGPIVAAFVSFVVGGIGLGIYLVLARHRIGLESAGSFPAWVWLGGLLGALYVAVVTLLIPRLGPATMMCLVIFGQVTAALLLDKFGVLQSAPRTVDAVRIAGAALVMAGVILVAAPWRTSPSRATATETNH
ncbi:MAG: DMT family transporter [Proteobacteria bacterium]|nr:DMT family transporter [Pseudomonadota bacterium]